MILSTASLSSITEAPSLVEDIDFICGSNSTSYPLAHKLRNINIYYYDTVSDIIAEQTNWEWDDTNKTDFPIGTSTMVADQQDYELPSTFLKMLRVEVKDAGGQWQKLQQFDETQIDGIGLSDFMESSGMPRYYREIGDSIELYPKPSASATTLTAGLKVYYQRIPTDLTKSDASVSPGFSPLFHRILSLGASYEYACANSLANESNIKNRLEEMRVKLKEFYASQNREVKPKLQVKRLNYE